MTVPPAPVVVLTGPTATGKTDVALALAERLPVSIISMDSAMVYRGMDIGTAKPPLAVRERHPHALVDIRDPAEPYSAADFIADADRAVGDALAAGRLPLLVGGTMLYLKAFREGLAPLPPADPAVRSAIAADAQRRGWDAVFADLARVDPEAATRLHPHNHVRVQRALEVHRLTGTPISGWWAARGAVPAEQRLGVRLVEVALVPAHRSDLADPIERRFRAMIQAGLLDEVAALRARPELSLTLPSMRAVGYRQAWEHLEGGGDLEELVRRGTSATRSLAKRQLTWLRGWRHIERLPPGPPAALAGRIAAAAQLELS